MKQHKKVTQIENSWSLYDLIDQELEYSEQIDQELEYSEQKHWLDQCPDVTPERLNEIVLEVTAELMAENDLRKAV